MFQLDAYNVQARIYPGILAAVPVIMLVAPYVTTKIYFSAIPILAASGVFFFLLNFVRSRGLQVERQLIREWDGLPTTKMLRFRNCESATLLNRRREKIEKIYGHNLPTRQLERRDSEEADRVYRAAVRSLIDVVNQNRNQFPRVHDENIQYGYRRNLLGIKNYALTVLSVTILVDIALMIIMKNYLPHGVILGLHMLMLSAWLFVVNGRWVREAAERYTQRLFEALEFVTVPMTASNEEQ